jgi:hypothetical protein
VQFVSSAIASDATAWDATAARDPVRRPASIRAKQPVSRREPPVREPLAHARKGADAFEVVSERVACVD